MRENLTAAPIRINNEPRKVNTVYGKETLNVKRCPCCDKVLPITEFYQHGEGKASASKDKKGTLRSMCVTCYDGYVEVDGEYRQRKGRYDKPNDKYVPSNNLESFYDEK